MNTLAVLFLATTAQLDLPPRLLSSLCYVESKHDVAAVHHDDGGSDSLGICQIKLETARWLGFKGTRQQLMNPKTNIRYAGIYLKYQLIRYNGQLNKAIISYNRGNSKNLTYTPYYFRVIQTWRGND